MCVYISYQSGGETQDGEECSGGGEGGVLADTRLLPHLHVGCCDVVGQGLWNHRLLVLTLGDVAPAGREMVR